MLFKADFHPSSRLADLRSRIDGLIKDRAASKFVTRKFKVGPLPCDLYEHEGSTDSGVTYEIHRCNQLPFGFAEVELKVPSLTEIHIQVESYQSPGQALTSSRLGSKDDVARLEQETEERLLARAETNWRVWTWRDAGKTYKMWAQFGGTLERTKPIGKDVLLWDEEDKEWRIPVADLWPTDQDWVRRGRVWVNYVPGGEKNPRRVLMSIKGNELELGRWDENQNKIEKKGLIDKNKLVDVDKTWFERHQKSIRSQKLDAVRNNPKSWGDSARYVR